MRTETVLEHLGFPKHSGTIYESITKHPLSVSEIARKTKTYRPAVYRALDAMIATGLVIRVGTEARPLYKAGDRRRIWKLFTTEARELSRIDNPTEHAAVQFFSGKTGITRLFDDVVAHTKRGDTFYRYTSERDLTTVNKYLSKGYRKHRDTKRLERLVISNRESGDQKRPRLERFIKYLGSDTDPFDQDAIQLIYGNRVAFIDIANEQGIVIENERLASFQKQIFRALYRTLR